ncbi:MAG TPA: HAD-IA family hydrolase [Roseateles sp.]|nr:HAD-IA family hydrolase [Roseateles sp.]
MKTSARTIWLFDLDNTVHNASHHVFGALNVAMTDYIVRHLGVERGEANRLRSLYWARYGATLLGLVRHHGVRVDHFLAETHELPGLEALVHSHAHDLAALRRLPGRKILLTNAPAAYARRVLGALGLARLFERVVGFEAMRMFGQHRPKPDARMLRWVAARHRLPLRRCVLVEDTLVHQKAARSVGMGTIWMQRWVGQHGPEAGTRLRRRPAYVDRRVSSLADLARWPRR